MAGREIKEVTDTDYTAAVPLEISSEVAERADDLLREFAEEAGLSSALVVDRSGALVAGISSESDVTIEVISALVAGASGAMRALVSQLGETGNIESLHFGAGRLVYLREVVNRFILVGVSDGSRPAGLVRQKARMVKDELWNLLKEIAPGQAMVSRDAPPAGTRSLREVAMERAAQRSASGQKTEPSDEVSESASVAELIEAEPVVDATSREEAAPAIPEPREVLEPLDFGDPEIVIEPGPGAGARQLLSGKDLAVFSPFEEDEDSEDDDGQSELELSGSGSIFELEEDIDEEEGIFSALDGEASIRESEDETSSRPINVFEVDEFDPEPDEETEDIGAEINEMMDEEDQETEVRSSGPFYF